MARTYRSTPEPVYANKTAELVKEDGSIIKTDDLQEKLTFDTTPTANSTNPVTSGGIKTYVDGLMSGALKRAIVEELPTTDIDTNTIYMVLDETASAGNVYNEYLYINNAWELIGTTAVSGGGESNTIIDYDIYNKINSNNYIVSVANLKQLLTDVGINLNNSFENIYIASELITVALGEDEDPAYYIFAVGADIVRVSSLIMNPTFNNVLTALGNGTFSTISLPINVYGVYPLSIRVGDNFYPITKQQLLNLFVEQE